MMTYALLDNETQVDLNEIRVTSSAVLMKGREYFRDYSNEVGVTVDQGLYEDYSSSYSHYTTSSRSRDEFNVEDYLNADFIVLLDANLDDELMDEPAEATLYDSEYYDDLLLIIPESLQGMGHERRLSSLIHKYHLEVAELHRNKKKVGYKYESGPTPKGKYLEMKYREVGGDETW